MDFMTVLLKHTNIPLAPPYTGNLLTKLFTILMTADDNAILQCGQETLKLLIQRDFSGVKSWTDGQQNGLEYAIKFIARLLDPGQSESAAIFVGDLIVVMIKKAGDDLLPVLPELLGAVLRRLSSAKMHSLIQTLVLVFAHYIHTQLDTVLSFLQSINIEGKDGLTILMNTWCDNHDSFQGFHTIKVSASALSILYMSQDSRVSNIQVKGDLVTSQPGSEFYSIKRNYEILIWL
jgi:hypothetical protein